MVKKVAKRITNALQYSKRFSGGTEQIERALSCALSIRQFEIDLYWKRATYFWTLIAAALAGYFVLSASTHRFDGNLQFILACIGLVLSSSWYLVNRGSKYWQTNWERHVDALENEIMGPLYKTTIANGQFSWLKFWDGYPYSVSKVTQLVSLYVVVLWAGLAACSCPFIRWPAEVAQYAPQAFAAITAVFLVLLHTLGLRGSQGKPRPVDFCESELVDSEGKAPPERNAREQGPAVEKRRDLQSLDGP